VPIISPITPVKSSHRIISKIVGQKYGDKVEKKAPEFDKISKVFQKMGGSWERLFYGSLQDVTLLKKVISIAYKKGLITKKDDW
jgi:hypothetical protein